MIKVGGSRFFSHRTAMTTITRKGCHRIELAPGINFKFFWLTLTPEMHVDIYHPKSYLWNLAELKVQRQVEYLACNVEATGFLLPNCYFLSSTLGGSHWKGESYKLFTESQAHPRGIIRMRPGISDILQPPWHSLEQSLLSRGYWCAKSFGVDYL